MFFGQPNIKEQEINEVVDTLESGWIGTGPRTKLFEEMFADFKGVEEALATNSGTAALHLALADLDLYPNDEVIVPSMTFSATAHTVLYTKAKLILVDCDKAGNIDPEDIWKNITPRTRAIVIVHYAGRPVNMSSIIQLANKYNLIVIEDCAHAVEAEYNGKPVGTLGHYGCFSFYATKNITTGDGGMLISKRSLERSRIRAFQGQSAKPFTKAVVELGYKYNMIDIQAALGIHQLGRVERNWERRNEIWERYNEAFKDLDGIEIPRAVPVNRKHGKHLYTLLVKNREKFRKLLEARGIYTGIHYKGLHLHPFYKKMGFDRKKFPKTNSISFRTTTIPFSSKLNDNQVDQVIENVKEVAKQC